MHTQLKDLPTDARVVVVGGGIIGTSIAYHLAKMGWTDTVLLERDRLTSGTTWCVACAEGACAQGTLRGARMVLAAGRE